MFIGYEFMRHRLIFIVIFIVMCSGVIGFANAASSEYGHLSGVVQADGGNSRALNGAVVYVISSDQMYYSFAAGNGAYDMLLPVGHYRVYAQYQENGFIYQSRPLDVDVNGSTTNEGSNPIQITVPLSAPSGNPDPTAIPGTYTNTVKGIVTYQDGSSATSAVVTLWQSSDDSSGMYYKKAETTTDASGNYLFSDVKVTTDPPVNEVIYGMKTFRVSATFTDTQGIAHVKNQSFPLYNPNVILGLGQSVTEARNVSADLRINYMNSGANNSIDNSNNGWINITSDPAGARVFVDNQPLLGSDGKQLRTPCTAYIAAGKHTIKLSLDRYTDSEYPVYMAANLQTQDLMAFLNKPMVPAISGWFFLLMIAAFIILLIVLDIVLVLVIIALLKKMKYSG
jgi:hypothetical protein